MISELPINKNTGLDKNISYYINELKKEYKEDFKYIISLLVYISSEYQRDLFSFGTIDVSKMAKKLNISKSNLTRNCPNASIYNYLRKIF